MVRNQFPMNRWRSYSTAVSSDGQKARIPQNYRGRPSFTSVSFLADEVRDPMPANANNSVLTKYPSRSWLFWAKPKPVGSNLYQSRKTFRLTSEILKMNPTLKYFLSLNLKPASNQLHSSSSNWCQGSHGKGTLIEFLSRIILTKRLSHGASFPQYFNNC